MRQRLKIWKKERVNVLLISLKPKISDGNKRHTINSFAHSFTQVSFIAYAPCARHYTSLLDIDIKKTPIKLMRNS